MAEIEEETSLISKIGENVSEALSSRQEALPEAFEDTSPYYISQAQIGLRLGGHLAGAVLGDVIGETISTTARHYAPQELQDLYDNTAASIAKTFVESDVGQNIITYLEENPAMQKDLDAILNVSSAVPIAFAATKIPQIVSRGASNLPAKMDIYKNPLTTAYELTKGGTVAAGRTIVNTLSPQRRAAQRALGMSPSKIKEASKRLESGEKDSAWDYGHTALLQAHYIKRQTKGGEYPEDFKQSPIVKKYIEDDGLDISATDTETLSKIINKGVGYTIPRAVLNRIIDKVPGIHKAPKENTSVNVNRLGNPSRMVNEASPTVTVKDPKAIEKLMKEKGLTKKDAKAEVETYVTIKTRDQASQFTRILRDPDGESHPKKYAEKKYGKGSKKSDIKNWEQEDWATYLKDELKMVDKNGDLNAAFFEADGRKYVSFANQSHNSKDKTLGGVNNYYIIDITGGKGKNSDIISYNTISDLHDLKVAGKDLIPPGGSHILNIFPPVKHNISTYKTQNKPGEGGIQTQETLGLRGGKEVKEQARELLEKSKSIKPTLKDRMGSARAATTVAAVPISPLLAQEDGNKKRSLLSQR